MGKRIVILWWVAVVGCSSAQKEAGIEGSACYPNQTCNAGLVCQAGLDRCVTSSAGDAGSDGKDTTNALEDAPELVSIADSGGVTDLIGLSDLVSETTIASDASDSENDVGPETTVAPLTWGPCDTTVWPDGYPKPGSKVECTTVDVPLDHSQQDGPTIAVRVARQKSLAFPTGKAVFNLAGGPGGGSVTQSGTIPYYFPKLLNSYDMIYVDQRGTGASNYLGCAKGYPSTQAEWKVCAGEHSGTDLNHYLTTDAAHDLELVRKRLGYGKIYLRGGSYGTRLGLEFMRQHESSIAAIVLDGLAPPEWDIFGNAVTIMDKAVQQLIDDCNSDTACKALVPDLATDLAKRREALQKEPRKITIGGQPTLEDEATFVMLLSAFVDVAKSRYKIPRAIHNAMAGDNADWNALISTLVGAPVADVATSDPAPRALPRLRLPDRTSLGAEYVAPGLHATVVCAEWFPNSGGISALESQLAKQTWASTDRIDLAAACQFWNVSPLDASWRKPVASKIRTLLLSGEIDVRTPPEMGTQALKTLPNGTHLIIPYASHSTISVPCAAQIITDFFDADGEISKVDTSCIGKIPHPGW